tara:strand:- start:2520 stop:3476 length:957 start_codon:yes stop_codon:yes gene_type:complete
MKNIFIYNFYKSSIVTIILLYTLVLIGGFVRITESGDDCPDWPKCYGSWFPPISIEDIPQEFNPSQDKVYGSWIEYFNRMIGVILGLSMLVTFYKSIYVFKYDKQIFYGSLTSLILVIIAGWFGGQIANNVEGINIMSQHSVSIHLYIAILTLISIVYTTNRGFILLNPDCEKNHSYTNESYFLFFSILIINLLLVFSGSFIRSYIDDDSIKKLSYLLRMEFYVKNTGLIKFTHPILGFAMLGLLGILWNHIINLSKSSKILVMFLKVLMILILMQIVIGEGLRFNFIHETFRLYHLWISTVILGIIIIATQRIKLTK